MRGLRTPKGTVDFHPSESKLINEIIKKCETIFRIHGGRSIDTPTFELLSILQNKSEEETLLFELNDQGGDICGLRFDLTVPLARYLAQNKIYSLRRYQIGKVFRRDQPAITKGRYREFYQCDFDICGKFLPLLPDAEVLKIAAKILRSFEIGNFKFKINHRKLITAMCLSCVEPDYPETVSTIIPKLPDQYKLGEKGFFERNCYENSFLAEKIKKNDRTTQVKQKSIKELFSGRKNTIENEKGKNCNGRKKKFTKEAPSNGKTTTENEKGRKYTAELPDESHFEKNNHKEKLKAHLTSPSQGQQNMNTASIQENQLLKYDENTDFAPICSAIDKLEKIGIIKVKEEIVQKGWSILQVDRMEKLLKMKDLEEVEEYFNTKVERNSISQRLAMEAIEDLQLFLKYVKILEESECVEFEISLARGLNYYTGLIFEAVFQDHTDVGSVLGGGRYDNLVGQFCNNKVPAIGFSVGILRIFSILKQKDKHQKNSFTKILIVPRNIKFMEYSLRIINDLWNQNIPSEINSKKRTDIADMKKYARKEEIPYLLLIGEEIVDNKAVLYKLEGQETEFVLTLEQIIEHLKE